MTVEKTAGGLRVRGGSEGDDCKRRKIIPILALLEKRESYCRTKNLLNCAAFQNFYCTLQLLVYGRSSIFVLYEQSAS